MNAIPRLRLLAMPLALFAAGLAGCKSGPPVGHVKGKVTFKGNPVTEGKVGFFNPTTSVAVEADLEKDGSYVVKTPLEVGDYVVVITPPTYVDNSQPTKTPPAPSEKDVPNIPRKYRG